MLSSMRAQIFQPIWSTDKQTLTAQTSDYSNAQAVSYCTCITSSSYRVQCYTRTVFVSPPFLCVFPIYYSSYYAFFHFDYNKGFLFYFSTYPYPCKTISLHKISVTLKHLWFLLLLVFFPSLILFLLFFPKERDAYLPLAESASKMYFVITDLSKINNMYRFSLASFLRLFQRALQAKKVTGCFTRLIVLTSSATSQSVTFTKLFQIIWP